jgi:hypothetical protein
MTQIAELSKIVPKPANVDMTEPKEAVNKHLAQMAYALD